jgi:GNAT superfamily N-acetyltransferase
MKFVELTTDAEILSAREVMRQLRSGVAEDDYLATVRRMMAGGYRQVALVEDGEVRAVAGFRIFEMLYVGRLLYVDDLNTDERLRSRGHGRALLDWLKSEARANDCAELHLDSGVQRASAHRFYFREGLTVNCFHFRIGLSAVQQ